MRRDVQASGTVPLEVRYVRDALTREFANLIDIGELARTAAPYIRDAVFLSHALAAKAVRIVTNCSAKDAADAVVDGPGDFGIDAVAVSESDVWLIQAKWSDRGTAALRTADVLKLHHGLRLLARREYSDFNARLQRQARRIDDTLASASCRIHLVAAVMGQGHVSDQVDSLLSEVNSEFGFLDDSVDYRVLNTEDFHSAVRQDVAQPPPSVTATLTRGWYEMPLPYRTYMGVTSAEEVARWHAENGNALFAGSMRTYLGETDVNRAMVDTLTSSPQDFWYFNNGITVLCDSLRKEFFGRAAPGEPLRLHLSNAQVVNGAQTVSAIRSVYESGAALDDVLVQLRVICTEDAPDYLSARICEAANRQNRIEARDFITLDPEQAMIQADFALTLAKEYVFTKDSVAPAPAAGCTVAEAATALACAHPDASLVARVRADAQLLWNRAPDGIYAQLFAVRPGARQIWRSVQLLREVTRILHDMAASLPPRFRAAIDHGSLLVTHIVFLTVGSEGIDEPDTAWDDRAAEALKQVPRILSLLVNHVDDQYGPHVFLSAAFTDADRCARLGRTVAHTLGESPAAPPAFTPHAVRTERRERRPNTVHLLVERGRIPDGTRLVFHPSAVEERAIGSWLSEDPRRYLATWVNDPRRPLLWEVDHERYSPTRLVLKIWEEAGWENAPVAVNGTRCWVLPEQGTLLELAQTIITAMPSDGTDAG